MTISARAAFASTATSPSRPPPATTPIVEYPDVPNFLDQIEDAMEGVVTVRQPYEELLISLGFGELLSTVKRAISEPRVFAPDRVQALMPFQIVVR